MQPYFGRSTESVTISKVHGLMGEQQEALRLLNEALVLVDKTGEQIYDAELHRLKGKLRLHLSTENVSEAVHCFQQAIAIAQNQHSKFWELRAVASLARLWREQGKDSHVQVMLARVYDWFTEGFDTIDLQDTKGLLEELS